MAEGAKRFGASSPRGAGGGRRRGTAHERGYTAAWQKEAKEFLRQHDFICAECGGIATVVDHIVPHRGDEKLFWDPTNLQPLCVKCHNEKTARGE